MLYVRKKPKGFGRNAQIEGEMAEGARILLVEDLASEGSSKLNFVRAIRDAGGEIGHSFVIFNYGIFPKSMASLDAERVKLHWLATWWDVLRVAKQGSYFAPAVLDEVERFLKAPAKWSAEHGGASTFPAN
jgi:orotate phosphoribosyltransferase